MKKEIWIPLYLLMLSLVFVTVSFLLYLSGGKNQKLLAKKLSLGAMIISITAAVGCTPIKPPHTCYVPPSAYVQVENEVIDRSTSDWKYSVEIDISETNIIKGKSMHSFGSKISFRITDTDGKIIQFSDAKPVDGEFNDHTEELEMHLNKDTEPGEYILTFYTREKALAERMPEDHLYVQFTLIIK